MTSEEIKRKYLAHHDALGKRKDALDKEKFDIAHRAVWAACNIKLNERLEKLQMAAKERTPDETEEFVLLKLELRK